MQNWSDLPILLAVAETGSLTAAGKRLGLSQPTTGRRIHALEEQFGAPLLTKSGNQLVPTELGQAILGRVRRMNEEAAAIARTSAAQAMTGSVKISSSEGIADWLPHAMRTFCDENPTILIETDVNTHAVNLAQHEADIALRWMGPGPQNSLIGRKVLTVGMGLYAASDYIQRHGRPLNLTDMAEHHCVMLQFDNGTAFWPDELDTPDTRQTGYKSNSMTAHVQAVQAGHGIGLLPICMAENTPMERVLPQCEVSEDLWVVAHQDLRKNPRVRAVYDYIVGALRRDRSFFAKGTPSIFASLRVQTHSDD